MPIVKTTLPKLLAGLPQYGQGQLVQPTSWQTKFPNSFYKITRTKLRFKSVDEAGKPIAGAAAVDKGKAKEQLREEDEFEEDNEDGDIFGGLAEEEAVVQQTDGRPHGKAWGVLFWNGESLCGSSMFNPPGLTKALPDPYSRSTQNPYEKPSSIQNSRILHLFHPRNRHSRPSQGVVDTTRRLCLECRSETSGGSATNGAQGEAADGLRADFPRGEEGD